MVHGALGGLWDHNEKLVYCLLCFAHFHRLKVFVGLFLFAVYLAIKVRKPKKYTVWPRIFSQLLATYTELLRESQQKTARQIKEQRHIWKTEGVSKYWQLLQWKTPCNKICLQDKKYLIIKQGSSPIKKNKSNQGDKVVFSYSWHICTSTMK